MENKDLFTDEEKIILKNLPKKVKYIFRLFGNIDLIVSENIGSKWCIGEHYSMVQYSHLFKNIICTDKPCEFRKYL